ncbi:MalY/PatB family protein [Actomonas aquatica]|uniref:cysteine-S-conjugate beta-lyase n=1 Tax=Actomonas aquatica TaxID=2866162 RepID=A0ABZ1C855_9BACT|nr:MalY/PatB family protein [Opitutus sp. WL0086]WRQ87617.1 MalY/PatB family protein [Opitutus sp. WL0086]
MRYDFDTVVQRRGTGATKWDASADPASLPMWVADMDFPTAPAIIEALAERVRHGIFGYTHVPDAYYDAVIHWFARRYAFPLQREWLLYTSGVVPAISAILRALTQPGDGVILQTPVYNCFFSSIRNLQCRALANPLREVDGRFEIDFEDLERQAADPSARVLLLCNPHNPVGRCWTAAELRRLGEICLRHDVTVVSDEIHCDLIHPGFRHQPFATLAPEFLARSITCHAPSKAFNIAGLQIANVIVHDVDLRARIDRALNIHEVCDVNPFGVTATIAAYTAGEDWLDALRLYLFSNYKAVARELARHLPALKLTPQEATYLAWIDCRALGLSSAELTARLAEDAHLLVSPGTLYGEDGEGFIRLNLACPRATLKDGLSRLRSALAPLAAAAPSVTTA